MSGFIQQCISEAHHRPAEKDKPQKKHTSERRATTVGRAADSSGTLVPLPSATQLTPETTPTEL
nr:hypothetical protein [uncultured Prevotella sp.]